MALKVGDKIPAPKFENIPDEMKRYPCFLLWKAKPRKDKPGELTKVPVDFDGKTLKEWNEPLMQYNFEVIKNAFQKEPEKFDGIGFVLAGTDLICIDLDNDTSTANISEELTGLTKFGYTEISPSGKGYHVWLKGQKPAGMGKVGRTEAGEKLEVFSSKSGWVTLTGNVFHDGEIKENQLLINQLNKMYFRPKKEQKEELFSSMDISNDLEAIKNKMFNARNGQQISALWNGDTSAYGGDDSSADLALCNHLAFYAKGNHSTVDALFRQSSLYRTKWDEKHSSSGQTYGEMTIEKAISSLQNMYGENYKTDVKPTYQQHIAKEIPPLNQSTLEEQKAEYLRKNNVVNHLQEFINGIAESVNTECIPTGFNNLDNALDGGLYEGLYIIGAVSSLGKTTFILHIGDQVAAAGHDVLIFSLEMARSELIAKSISRLTLTNMLENKGNIAHAKTARGITSGQRYADYSAEETKLITDSISDYERYGKHLFIVEGVGDIGVKEIRETVKQHIELTGNKPLVIIDYLQLLAPYNDRATDKQNTDKAILELKRISRDYKIPVFGISSLNRQSYNQPIGMEAFKESGAIEYSSDVLIGLQARGTGEADFDINVAKRQNPREIELKILKNRNGRTGDTILYEFYTLFNHFKERDIRNSQEQIQTRRTR